MDLPAKRAEHPWTRICFEHLRGVDAALRFGGCAGRGLSLRFAGRLLLRAYPAAGALEALDPERNIAMPLRPLLIFLAMQAAAAAACMARKIKRGLSGIALFLSGSSASSAP